MFVFWEEFVEGVRWVNGFVLFSSIFASILEDDLGAARVLCMERVINTLSIEAVSEMCTW
jgi:hypothetical protein